ncbi:MAG: hypothetical protein RLO51_00980 [Thalassobaculum sp.]|uniref:hypothetical protein n=1 Tax=Thalassobaculum sp. TaxID=2022740 RepID=UPI0032ECAAF3
MPRRLLLVAEIVRDVAANGSVSRDPEALVRLAETLEREGERLLALNNLSPDIDGEMQRILPTIRHLAAVFCPEAVSPLRD